MLYVYQGLVGSCQWFIRVWGPRNRLVPWHLSVLFWVYAPTTSKLTLLLRVCESLKSTRQRKLPASFSWNEIPIIERRAVDTCEGRWKGYLNRIYNQFRRLLVGAKDGPILEDLFVPPMRWGASVGATCVVAVKGIEIQDTRYRIQDTPMLVLPRLTYL